MTKNFKKIVLLSCDDVWKMVEDDHLLINELTNQGYEVTTVSWNSKTDWSRFDLALIRTTWDYTKHLEAFLQVLQDITKTTPLLNTIDVVRWNCHKGYLKELQGHGIKLLPTVFFSHSDHLALPDDWKGNRFIIKPCVSAGAYKTTILSRHEVEDGTYRNEMIPGDWMCQPFLESIKEGEVSLLFFNRQFSHALNKVPKDGDFRVQEEFGGTVVPLNPSEKLLKLGHEIIKLVPYDILYARVDLVPFENSYALMELEMIEPSLYFRSNAEAAKNFVSALEVFTKKMSSLI